MPATERVCTLCKDRKLCTPAHPCYIAYRGKEGKEKKVKDRENARLEKARRREKARESKKIELEKRETGREMRREGGK